MDHTRAPVLKALDRYHQEGQLPFTPPGHKQARGADPEVRRILGEAVFASDVLAMSGLDDRRASNGVLEEAEALMADAVPVAVPSSGGLRLEQTCLPRDAYFGQVEDVPLDRAADRVAAETLTPYPPGIPAALPGERLNQPVLDYLDSGIGAGMYVPDAADPRLRTVRVLTEQSGSEPSLNP